MGGTAAHEKIYSEITYQIHVRSLHCLVCHSVSNLTDVMIQTWSTGFGQDFKTEIWAMQYFQADAYLRFDNLWKYNWEQR